MGGTRHLGCLEFREVQDVSTGVYLRWTSPASAWTSCRGALPSGLIRWPGRAYSCSALVTCSALSSCRKPYWASPELSHQGLARSLAQRGADECPHSATMCLAWGESRNATIKENQSQTVDKVVKKKKKRFYLGPNAREEETSG